jgi:hypothetical protein
MVGRYALSNPADVNFSVRVFSVTGGRRPPRSRAGSRLDLERERVEDSAVLRDQPVRDQTLDLGGRVDGSRAPSQDHLSTRLAFAMTEISNADVRAWTAFAGYSLGSTLKAI